jgi:hypothetical protein
MSGLRSLQTHKRTSIALLAIRNGFFGKTEFAFRTVLASSMNSLRVASTTCGSDISIQLPFTACIPLILFLIMANHASDLPRHVY